MAQEPWIDELAPPQVANSAGFGESLARRASRGAVWSLLAFAMARGLAFATSLLLARLLDPADFGIVSFAMIAIGALSLLQDLGVPAAIIYGHRDAREVASTALTINVAMSVTLFVGIVLASPFLAAFARQPVVRPVAIALGAGLVISSLGSAQDAFLQKNLALRRKFIPDVVPLVVSGILSIALALLGFKAWSLVYGYLVQTLTATLLLWGLSSVRPRPGLRWAIAKDLIRYGRHVSLSAVIGFAARNADYFIVGHFLGSAQLGIYTLAYTIAFAPTLAARQATSTVAFPAYSRLRGDGDALARSFLDVMSLVCVLSVPVSVAIFVIAPAFASVVLSRRWASIVVPLQILAAVGVFQSIGMNFASVYKAIGRPDITWKFTLARLLTLAALMLFAVRYGIVGIAVVHLVATAVFVPVNSVVLARAMAIQLRQIWRAVAPPLIGGGVAAILIASAYSEPGLRQASHRPLGAFLLITISLTAYVVVLVLFKARAILIGRDALALLRQTRTRAIA